MNESYMYEWVTSHVWVMFTSHVSRNAWSYYKKMGHVTYKCAMSHINESCHVWIRHMRISESPCVYESCVYVMTHLEYVRMRESRRMHHQSTKYLYTWSGHVTHVNKSCHVWMSLATGKRVMSRVNESWHIWMSHVTYGRVEWRISELCRTQSRHTTL